MQANYTIESGRIVKSAQASHWVRVIAPDPGELDVLDDRYHFPFDYLQAGIDPHEDPRVVGVRDGSDKPALMVLRVPEATTNAQGDQVYETVPMAMILVGEQLVTVSAKRLGVVDAFIAHTRALGDAEDLALALLQAVLSAFVEDVDEMDQRTRAMESRLATASRNTLLYEIIALERSLVYFDAALTKTQAVVKKLSDSAQYFTTDEHLYRLHAVNVACEQVLTVCDCARALLDQYNTAVSAIVGNNLNLIMKVLTSVSIIMTIPAIVSGIWGMNTWLPLRHGMSGFFILLAVMGILCGACAWLLKKKDYF